MANAIIGRPPKKTLNPNDEIGWLIVLEFSHKNGRRYYWRCKCRCGKIKLIERQELLRSDGKGSRSCGCKKRTHLAAAWSANTKHGRSSTPEYAAWIAMLQRCYNSKRAEYRNYGARGIRVHERYRDDQKGVLNLIEDIGYRPSQFHSLHRINNDGDYTPGNLEWALAKTQCRNKRGLNQITIDGQTRCLAAWLEHFKLCDVTFYKRIERGWSVHRALTTRPRKRQRIHFDPFVYCG